MNVSEIVEAYQQGQHLRQIGEAVGRSHEWVRLTLLREGVKLRPRNSRKQCLSPLAEELGHDLPNFREPVTASVVADWFGCTQAEAVSAAAELFNAGRASISGASA